MDFQHALHIFNTLYNDVNGYTLSSQGKAQIPSNDKTFTYGEISPEAFHQILKDAAIPKKGVFYDLGSGTGKAVMMAFFLYQYSKCVGIEFLTTLHNEANAILQRYIQEYGEMKSPEGIVAFVNDDFVNYDFSNASVIFTHSTCFTEGLWEKLTKKFDHLASGTIIITVTRTVNSPYLAHIKSKEYGMAWGRATVHVYQHV
jgi:hypothetical protein